jgi:hypothetical protein
LAPEGTDLFRAEVPEEMEKTRYLVRLLLQEEAEEGLTTALGNTVVRVGAEDYRKDWRHLLLPGKDITAVSRTAVQKITTAAEAEEAQEEQAVQAVYISGVTGEPVSPLLLQGHPLIMPGAEEGQGIMEVPVPVGLAAAAAEAQDLRGMVRPEQTVWAAAEAAASVRMQARAVPVRSY